MLFLDTETYNPVGTPKAIGTYRYAETCEAMLFSYAFGPRGEPGLIDFMQGERLPNEVDDALKDPHVEVCAHHSMFDRNVLRHAMGYEVARERWHDTMVLAYTAGLPGSLDELGPVIGTPQDKRKLKTGKALMNLFCSPAPSNWKIDRAGPETHPEKWEQFRDYGRQDIPAMQQVWLRVPHLTYNNQRDLWLLDQKINDRGIAVDRAATEAAVRVVEQVIERLHAQVAEATGGLITSTNARDQVLLYLEMQGVYLESYAKDAVTEALEREDLPAVARLVLEARQQAGRSSTSKYVALRNAVSADGRLRGALQFYGANRTGRNAGRKVQLQNMPRSDIPDTAMGMEAILQGLEMVDMLFESPMDVAASCVRAALVPGPGKRFVVSDLASIEGRVVAWLAGERWKLDAYRAYDEGRGPDLYKKAYAESFGKPVSAVTKDERQIGKVEELALGFQGAVGAFQQMAKGYGVHLPDRAVVKIVVLWRGLHPKVEAFWHLAESMVRQALDAPGMVFPVGEHIQVTYQKPYLRVRLPSGRVLHYYGMKTKQVLGYLKDVVNDEGKARTTWVEGRPPRGVEPVYREMLYYYGKQKDNRPWGWVSTYGGKFTENWTQAVARDALFGSMEPAEAAGFEIVLSAHDELITESADGTDEELSAILATNPFWAPDLPLAAEGYTAMRYRK